MAINGRSDESNIQRGIAMKSTRFTAVIATASVLFASACLAQTATPNPPSEAPVASGSRPSDASSPHQREAMGGKNQTMKECMDTQSAKTPQMAKGDMTKACDEQMKAQKNRAHPATDTGTTPK
jgi:hypothetical protein